MSREPYILKTTGNLLTLVILLNSNMNNGNLLTSVTSRSRDLFFDFAVVTHGFVCNLWC